jgi:hypothetical protein
LLSILILVAGCGTTKPAVIVPPMEKYCTAPVRPVIEQKDIWTIQELLQMNLTIIDYSLKLEETIKCWEAK